MESEKSMGQMSNMVTILPSDNLETDSPMENAQEETSKVFSKEILLTVSCQALFYLLNQKGDLTMHNFKMVPLLV